MQDTFICAIIRSINEFAPGVLALGDCAQRTNQVGILFGAFLLLFGVLALFA